MGNDFMNGYACGVHGCRVSGHGITQQHDLVVRGSIATENQQNAGQSQKAQRLCAMDYGPSPKAPAPWPQGRSPKVTVQGPRPAVTIHGSTLKLLTLKNPRPRAQYFFRVDFVWLFVVSDSSACRNKIERCRMSDV